MSSFRGMVGVVLLCAAGVSGCGFQPLYGERQGASHIREFDYVQIAPIEDRIGQVFRNALLRRLVGKSSGRDVRYRLTAELRESKSSLAVQKSALATRANLKMLATFKLWSLETRQAIFSDSRTVTVSYNILKSEFATLMAEKNARARAIEDLSEEVRSRLGVFFNRGGHLEPVETDENKRTRR